jgi:DNA replication and repair protein RecF
MRAVELVVRSYRNLADMALVGGNGHGKTNLLEALAYPVLFRSVRGAADREVGRFGGPGFQVAVTAEADRTVAATYYAAERRKRITVDGEVLDTIAAAIGHWLVVGFFPTDLALVHGGAAERRRWMDRMLSLADAAYLTALSRFKSALAHRNAALRARDLDAARAFEPAMAEHGSMLARTRRTWVGSAVERWQHELAVLGEAADVTLRIRGDEQLVDSLAWPAAFRDAELRDLHQGQSQVGPHRDDLLLGLNGHALRHYGSTGQQRSAAVALRLLELETLAEARAVRPALLVDDVFAELDHERQRRLARRLIERPGQRIVTAPRPEDIPAELDLPRWEMQDGMVRQLLSTAR